jgi:metal-responsive CopG/Arc/MetJ family transcriptional regulator
MPRAREHHHPPTRREPMVVATIKVPVDLLRRCDAVAERELSSRAAVVRRAILRDLEQHEAAS